MKNLTIISGPAGSGKSTKLREFIREQEAAGKSVCRVGGYVTPDGIREAASSGRYDVVTADEVEDCSRRPLLKTWESIARQFPRIQFVVVRLS